MSAPTSICRSCYGLWNSWEADAVRMDMEHKVFADPSQGSPRRFFRASGIRSRGRLRSCPRFAAGRFCFRPASRTGAAPFAAQHAEGIFSAARGVKQMRAFCEDIASRAERLGRNPNDIPIMWAGQPLVAESEAEARETLCRHSRPDSARSLLGPDVDALQSRPVSV